MASAAKLLVTAALVAACGSSTSPPPAPLALAAGFSRCRVVENARNDGIALDLFYGATRVRFTRQHLYVATGDPRDDGDELACTKLDRRWGGGLRTEGPRRGTGYWKGFLDVRCDRVAGRVEVTCGEPTPAELAELDKNLEQAKAAKALPSP